VVSADVPIAIVGEAHEVDTGGGVVEQPLTNLTIRAIPAAIPSHIEVDISAMSIGDTIRVGDVALPEGVTTDLDPDEPVVIGRAGVVVEEVPSEAAEGEGEGEEGSTPPAGATPTSEGTPAGEGPSPSTAGEGG
jgi:large subunit ribosomal protein L25